MQPRLVFDGDCGFCRYTVGYARAVTGAAVEYRPYQEVSAEHSDVSESEFAASIQLFIDGQRYQGADAAFRTLAYGGRKIWWRLYRFPGLAVLFELLYRLTSRHRQACYTAGRVLIGPELRPRRHELTADLLYRGIALCAFCGFASFWWQAMGLIGSGGVLPLENYLDALRGQYGSELVWLLPSLFWLDASDLGIHLVCAAGTAATLIGVLGRWRLAMALVAYVTYLSLVHAGQVFMSYQWDVLLVECLVLAAVLSRAPTLGVWLARLLLFRFMLLSGAVKLLSGDPAWADGGALGYHFETQPLPTELAWYAHQLPELLLRWGVYATFVVELVVPFFIFLPRNPRLVAGVGFVLLEVLILLTGSYNFFNLLTIVLCISLLDDPGEGRGRWRRLLRGISVAQGKRWGAVVFGVLILVQGLVVTAATLTRAPAPGWLQITSPWLLANSYGLFAVMTTRRDELTVEGSLDGENWRAYGFPYKPGPLDDAPRLATPHQPRLDWQMWFAALGQPGNAPWIYDFVYALLEAKPAVLALLEDPFAGRAPTYVRIRVARYSFTTADIRRTTGRWWEAGEAREWLAPVRLRKPKITHDPLTIEPSPTP